MDPKALFHKVDPWIAGTLAKYGHRLLRYSVAMVFIWFGGLKITGDSAANELVAKTVFWLDPAVFLPVLGVWEVLIGVGLLWRPLIRPALFLMALQMPGTFLPLVILPGVCFLKFPFVPSL